jgi:hypothetical protein
MIGGRQLRLPGIKAGASRSVLVNPSSHKLHDLKGLKAIFQDGSTTKKQV